MQGLKQKIMACYSGVWLITHFPWIVAAFYLGINSPSQQKVYALIGITLQRNLKVSGAMGTVRASPKRSKGPKGRRWNRPRGVAGTAK